MKKQRAQPSDRLMPPSSEELLRDLDETPAAHPLSDPYDAPPPKIEDESHDDWGVPPPLADHRDDDPGVPPLREDHDLRIEAPPQTDKRLEAPAASQTPPDAPVKKTESPSPEQQKKKKRRRIVLRLLCMCFVIIIVFSGIFVYLFSDNDTFEITFYQYETDKLTRSLRVVVLADLHTSVFGLENSELVRSVTALQPDIIALVGDMVDKNAKNSDALKSLLERLVKVAPVYYALGNHELNRIVDRNEKLKEIITESGAVLLHNTIEQITVGDCSLNIGGLSLALARSSIDIGVPGFMDELNACEGFTLLLTHYPENFLNSLQNCPIDLALCGHAHGGLIRLPIVGGLYSPDQGLLPKLTDGINAFGDTTVVVSRGLGNSSPIPRVNNKPELVVVDIHVGIIRIK